MKKVITKYAIYAEYPIPPFYRVAYWDINRQTAIAYPIGIHWIARAIRRIWEWSYLYRASRLEKLLLEAECRGRDAVFDEQEERSVKEIKELVTLFKEMRIKS